LNQEISIEALIYLVLNVMVIRVVKSVKKVENDEKIGDKN
jgi:hypothetical protein